MDKPLLPQRYRTLLLSKENSSANKMHMLAELWSRGYFVECDWPSIRHRVKLRFEPDGKWHTAKSILDDVIVKFKDMRDG